MGSYPLPIYFHSLLDSCLSNRCNKRFEIFPAAIVFWSMSSREKRLDEGDTMPVLLAHYQGQPIVYSQGCIPEQNMFVFKKITECGQ